nr:hypothetical protein [Bacillus subtilis]
MTGQLKLEKRDSYKEFTVDYLEKFKDELIFVDGEGYKIWIEFKEKIIAIEKYYNTAEVLTKNFITNMVMNICKVILMGI